MGTQQFCLKWNNHHSNMLNVFEHLLSSEALVDVTLACEGLSLKAHKMVLSACSPFFQSLFLENPCKHPIVILKDMRYADLKAIIDFMYRGEVNVSQNQLSALLKTAETLKVKGLAEVSGEDGQSNGSGVVQQEVVQQTVPQATVAPGGGGASQTTTTTPSASSRAETPPLSRRKRGRPRRRSLSDSNRSDSEDQVPAKIREAESPEVIEDRDMDTSSSTVGAAEGTNGVQKLPLPLQTQTQTQSQQESRLTIDEVTSGDEGDFVEPSKLMEQSMTTENVPVFPDGQSSGSTLSPVPSQRLVLGSSSLVERSLQGPSTSDSQALVPVSLSSEISVAGHSSQDIPEDIKPTGLVSYDEPSLSPVAGPSHHSQDGSAMMMYMDSSGVPAIPGPSNYQADNKTSQPQPSQVWFDKQELKKLKTSLEDRKLFIKRGGLKQARNMYRRKPSCPRCLRIFYDKSTLNRHMTKTCYADSITSNVSKSFTDSSLLDLSTKNIPFHKSQSSDDYNITFQDSLKSYSSAFNIPHSKNLENSSDQPRNRLCSFIPKAKLRLVSNTGNPLPSELGFSTTLSSRKHFSWNDYPSLSDSNKS